MSKEERERDRRTGQNKRGREASGFPAGCQEQIPRKGPSR